MVKEPMPLKRGCATRGRGGGGMRTGRDGR